MIIQGNDGIAIRFSFFFFFFMGSRNFKNKKRVQESLGAEVA